MSGVALMPLAPITMCQKNVLDVQNSLQAVLQLEYNKVTLAAWGIPAASERGGESKVAHKWARWLHNPCRLGDPHRFKARSRIGSGSNQKWKILFLWGHATKRGLQSGGTTSKVAELGGRTKLWMCSPKEYHQKFSASKNTLKTPPQTIFKKGGGFKTPHAIRFLTNPPPWTAALPMDVVRLTEENTRLRSEGDNEGQVRERALADATRLWQLVGRLGGDSPMRGSQGMGMGSGIPSMGSRRETHNVIPSTLSRG